MVSSLCVYFKNTLCIANLRNHFICGLHSFHAKRHPLLSVATRVQLVCRMLNSVFNAAAGEESFKVTTKRKQHNSHFEIFLNSVLCFPKHEQIGLYRYQLRGFQGWINTVVCIAYEARAISAVSKWVLALFLVLCFHFFDWCFLFSATAVDVLIICRWHACTSDANHSSSLQSPSGQLLWRLLAVNCIGTPVVC